MRLSPGQILFLFGIIAAFGFLTHLAIAKWLYEKRLKERKLLEAQSKVLNRGKGQGSPPPPANP
jgi:hypothetical protein